jgi:hypothetical protein
MVEITRWRFLAICRGCRLRATFGVHVSKVTMDADIASGGVCVFGIAYTRAQ